MPSGSGDGVITSSPFQGEGSIPLPGNGEWRSKEFGVEFVTVLLPSEQ